jgi:crotonobetainyl-CoA:carnitine CoA-transferase CaiB-like acyl-CoA transferase
VDASTAQRSALDGVKVADFSIWMFGPIATQVLGDFGAEVIKVEPPGGEPGRGEGLNHPLVNGVSTRYLCRNRNKRSVCLNLRHDEGRGLAERLVADCDVMVTNFRPGVAERLGLSYARLSEINPGLIYVAGSGYGPSGPYAGRGGQDRTAQALSGFMAANGDPGTPPFGARGSIMDFIGGMTMVQGILVALLARQRTGRGQRVDISLLDAAVNANTEHLTTYLNTGEVVTQSYEPLMRAYPTKDGYLQVVTAFARSKDPLGSLCAALQRPELAEDPRFATPAALARHEELLAGKLEEVFRTRTTAEWLDVMDAHDIIAAPVLDFPAVVADPQVQHNDILLSTRHPTVGDIRLVGQPVKLSDTPARVRYPPPLVGEHTDEVLTELGLSAVQITALRESGTAT